MMVPFAVWYWPTKRVAYLGKNAMCSNSRAPATLVADVRERIAALLDIG